MPVRQSVTFEDPVNNTGADKNSPSEKRRSRRIRRSASVGPSSGPAPGNRAIQRRFLTELQDQVDGVQVRTRTLHKIATNGDDMREMRKRDEDIRRAPVFNPRLSRAFDKYSALASSTTSLADMFTSYSSSTTFAAHPPPPLSEPRAASVTPMRVTTPAAVTPATSSQPLSGLPTAIDYDEYVNFITSAKGDDVRVDVRDRVDRVDVDATLADADVALASQPLEARCTDLSLTQVPKCGEITLTRDSLARDAYPTRVTIFDEPRCEEAFYQLVEVRPRVIKHKLKVRPQVEEYEVSVGGGYTAPCQPGPLRADLYDEYRSEILSGRRSRTQFLDDHALDCGIVARRHHRDRYLTPSRQAFGSNAVSNYEFESTSIPPPRRYAVGDATINVSKRTVRTASPPPALLSSATPTIPVLAPIKHTGYGREHKTQKSISSFSNQVDLIGKRSDKIISGSKSALYNVSLADGLEFIRSMLKGGSGYTLATAVQAAKSADIDPYGRKAKYHSTMGDGWVGPTENWREKVRKWEQEELSLLEEEQGKRRTAAFHEWEERMGEAELMESGRAERLKELQNEWAQAEVQFREEAMAAERERQSRLNAKSLNIEEIDVGEEAKKIKEQKEAERKAALAKTEADRQAKDKKAAEEREEAERKKISEREAALQREAEERKRIDEEEKRKKKEEEERIAREKKEEEERIKREEEERLKKEKEEAERLKREEEERIRKEEEERLRLEEEERKREEEEIAKKYGTGGFGSFGADPFADDDEEEAPEAVQEEEEQPEEQPEEPQEEKTQELPSQDLTHEDTESSHVDEGVELIADDEDTQHDYSYASAKDTIIEEEEPADDADSSDALAHQEHLNLGQEDADDSAAATADSLNVADEDESSWQETEVNSGASFEAEVNKDGTVTEEESIETLPAKGYSVTGDMPSIEIGGEDDDFSSYSKTTSSWGGAEEDEDEDEGSTTRRTKTTTTTVTEETENRRTLKNNASIDTHDHEIIIYNKDGVEITRVTHGDVIVGFDKVDEVVMVKHGLLTVSHETGECLVKIVDGEKHGTDRTEVNVFEFEGEVIVRSLIDVAHKYLIPKKTERKLSIHDIERDS